MSIIHIPQHPDIDALSAFEGLPRERIAIPASAAAFAAAVDEILTFPYVGFDTESKPTFKAGEVSGGPHLIQFATPHKAYLFQVVAPGCIDAARAVLEAPGVVKFGFGLKSDRSRLRSKLGIELHTYIDLGKTLRYQGKKGQVGLRGAVAGVLNMRVRKSRSVATSNWANTVLSEAQQAYAANDAYAALRVFLGLSAEQQRLLLQLASTPPQPRRAKPRHPLREDASR
ncbi:3'-5' exonuclease domain-containing protein 2 [Stutzerimonas stutzeri]|uniref:3'-5' exonuclease domain-containing protein 2 n=1 Tax=Stutzerimonas sp. S1 TaxID=3030652 RepID=UPI002225680E|nr:3'-5' exonuclease domain-containing protein 2 [Stutzerimonas sp. S1]MCW3147871.1 3'-5' exonuclease domain-containing protein 2 [Stutzerimonas sp. S1]